MMARLFDNDSEVANARMDKILEVIQHKDKDTLKAMFSRNAINDAENMDETIQNLFDLFQGDVISYDDWSGPAVEESWGEDGHWKSMESTYDVETNQQNIGLQ